MSSKISPSTIFTFSCPTCRSSKYHTLSLFRNGYEIVRCHQCELQCVKLMPEPETILAYYQNPEYYKGEVEGYHNYMEMAKVLLPLAERRLIQIEACLPGKVERYHILDVGCAAGFFLQKAQTRGWKISGVEVAADMAEIVRQRLGISVYSSLESVEQNKASLNAITLWEVVEHVPDPHTVLSQIFRLLKPGGILALSTPNTGHWQAIEYPDKWPSYCPPAHLLFFTRSSLKATLVAAGFEVISIQGNGPFPRLPGFIQHLFGPIHQGLAQGNARFWFVSLYAWRAIRLLALMRDRILGSQDDVMMTLEVMVRRPLH